MEITINQEYEKGGTKFRKDDLGALEIRYSITKIIDNQPNSLYKKQLYRITKNLMPWISYNEYTFSDTKDELLVNKYLRINEIFPDFETFFIVPKKNEPNQFEVIRLLNTGSQSPWVYYDTVLYYQGDKNGDFQGDDFLLLFLINLKQREISYREIFLKIQKELALTYAFDFENFIKLLIIKCKEARAYNLLDEGEYITILDLLENEIACISLPNENKQKRVDEKINNKETKNRDSVEEPWKVDKNRAYFAAFIFSYLELNSEFNKSQISDYLYEFFSCRYDKSKKGISTDFYKQMNESEEKGKYEKSHTSFLIKIQELSKKDEMEKVAFFKSEFPNLMLEKDMETKIKKIKWKEIDKQLEKKIKKS